MEYLDNTVKSGEKSSYAIVLAYISKMTRLEQVVYAISALVVFYGFLKIYDRLFRSKSNDTKP